jgi:hypothetical protein
VPDLLESVEAELGRMPARVGGSALAALARECAVHVEAAKPGSTPGAMWAQRLQDALRELRALAPPMELDDGIDELTRRRAERRSGAAG